MCNIAWNNTFFGQNKDFQSMWWPGHPSLSDQPSKHQDVHTIEYLKYSVVGKPAELIC